MGKHAASKQGAVQAIRWDELTPSDQRLAKETTFQSIGYVPQPAQLPVHESQAQVIVVSGGEGSGKSKTTSAEITGRYPTWRRVLFVCYKQESAENEADYLYEFLDTFKAVRSYRKPKQGNIELTTRDGAIVESVSTHSEGERAVSGTGKTYDIIAMLEAGKQRYSVFLACLLRISRTGGLLILSGTIEKSEPWFPDVINRLQGPNDLGAQVVIIPTWENRTLYPGGRDDPKIKAIESELGEDLFMERCAGQPAKRAGLVFPEFSHLTHVFEWVQYDPKMPVSVAIDPGYSGSHYSVNFIQEHPRAYTRQFTDKLPDAPLTDVWVIGDLYLDHAVHEEVIQVCKQKPWWSRVENGVGDVVMKTHPMADRAPVDVWLEKAGIFLRGQLVGIDDGIDRHHTFLKDPLTGSPRIFFNPSCQGAPREYGKWGRKEIGEKAYGDPDKNYCDAMKAIQYWLIDRFGRIERKFSPQARVVGTRTGMERSVQELPPQVGVARPPHPIPVAGPAQSGRSPYVVVPREPRKPVG